MREGDALGDHDGRRWPGDRETEISKGTLVLNSDGLNQQKNQQHLRQRKHHSHEKDSHSQTRHQIETIDEFTVARIYQLWDQWLLANLQNGKSKHEFYRDAINGTTGLEDIKLATVYVLLARLDAAECRATQQTSAPLSGTPNAEANPV